MSVSSTGSTFPGQAGRLPYRGFLPVNLFQRRIEVKIDDYFRTAKGQGVLATADEQGKVNVAIYAVPHVIDDKTIAFIMTEKLTHKNLKANPHAAYLFIEEEERYNGKRLYLTKVKEEKDSPLLDSIRRKEFPHLKGKETLVYFRVDKILPLIGAGAEP